MSKLLKLSLIIVFFCLSLFVHAYAEDMLRPTGYEAVVVNDTVGGVALTTAKYFTASTSKVVSDYAIIILEGAQVRFTVDGTTAPTITVGAPMEVGQVWGFENFDELKNFRAIKTGGTNGNLKVLYYKRYVR